MGTFMTDSTRTAGFSGLLANVGDVRRHCLVLSDFPMPPSQLEQLRAELSPSGVPVYAMRAELGVDDLLQALEDAGVDTQSDYIWIQSIFLTQACQLKGSALLGRLAHADHTKIELPGSASGAADRARRMLEVVSSADYDEQEQLSQRFFQLLSLATPYQVDVLTAGGHLRIDDDRPWFQLAGRLGGKEERALPGGEVAYTGSRVSGTFVVDGAILATPSSGPSEARAEKIVRLSAHLRDEPLTVHIHSGRVTDITSNGSLARNLLGLLNLEDYRVLTEVGVSFNRACGDFIHEWAAPSNEGRPGVHIALGGDPDPTETISADRELVHVDLMAATTSVAVNRQLYIRTRYE
jgi:hypothetical protein